MVRLTGMGHACVPRHSCNCRDSANFLFNRPSSLTSLQLVRIMTTFVPAVTVEWTEFRYELCRSYVAGIPLVPCQHRKDMRTSSVQPRQASRGNSNPQRRVNLLRVVAQHLQFPDPGSLLSSLDEGASFSLMCLKSREILALTRMPFLVPTVAAQDIVSPSRRSLSCPSGPPLLV